MPMSVRPKGWTNEYIHSTSFHANGPLLLADRVHPMHMADALDWSDDAGAPFVLLSGGLGRIDAFAEEATGATIGPNPTFNQIDANLFSPSSMQRLPRAILRVSRRSLCTFQPRPLMPRTKRFFAKFSRVSTPIMSCLELLFGRHKMMPTTPSRSGTRVRLQTLMAMAL